MRRWLIVAAVLGIAGCGTVDEGERAVFKVWGKMDQTCYKPGFYMYNPLSTNMDDVDVQVQKLEAKKLGAATADTQEIHADIVVNYHPDSDRCHLLIGNIGHGYADKVIQPAVLDALKAGTAHFTLATIIKDREKLREMVKTDLKARLEMSYVTVTDVNLTNFEVSREFTQAVERKQVAEQNVITATRNAEMAQAEAKGKADAAREAAKGEADAARFGAQGFADRLRIEAEAQSNYNRKVSESLTPILVQNRAVDAWREGGSHVPQIVGAGGLMLQVPMPTLQAPKPARPGNE